MKKVLRAFIISAITIALALIFIVLYNKYNDYKNGIVSYTINGNIVHAATVNDISSELSKGVMLRVGDIDLSDALHVSVDTSEINEMSFIDYIFTDNVNCGINAEIDELKLKDLLTNYNETATYSTDAYINRLDSGSYEVVNEIIGTKVDTEALDKEIIEKYNDNNIESLDINNFKLKPSVTSGDLIDIVNEAEEYRAWTIEYENGQKFGVYDPDAVVITDDNTIEINESFLKNDIIKELEKQYDKVGSPVDFTNHNGDTIEVSGGTWGTLMDSAKELEYITEAFYNKQSEYNRTPIMKQTYSVLGNTYIEVSIAEQYLWVYKDGALIMESPIVTGDITKGRGTPKGIYFISERVNGKNLRGADYVTWVNKWMRLTNGGVGLHDAYWRGSFGGSIYKGNGSHGCINLPKSFAYDLYDKTYVGMPVIIY